MGGTGAGRLAARLNELHEAMKQELDLSSEQREALEGLFEDHLRRLEESSTRQRAERAEAMERLAELRTKMIEANKDGDVETARALRDQMMEEMEKRRPSSTGGETAEFLEALAKHLENGQLARFRELVKRLRLDRPDRFQGGPFRALMRAVRDPDLGLSDEQRRAVHDIVRETLKTVSPKESTGSRMDEAAKVAREKILELLAPEQRVKFEALLGTGEGDDSGTPETPAPARERSVPEKPGAPQQP